MADETDGQMLTPKDGGNAVSVTQTDTKTIVSSQYHGLDGLANVGGKILCGLAGLLFTTAAVISIAGGPRHPGSDRAKYSKQAGYALEACGATFLLGVGAIKYSNRDAYIPPKEDKKPLTTTKT